MSPIKAKENQDRADLDCATHQVTRAMKELEMIGETLPANFKNMPHFDRLSRAFEALDLARTALKQIQNRLNN